MKKVLIVSYNFPPVGGAGVQRPVKFVKYLRTYGWEPVVLTVANPSVPVFDRGLLNDIPQGVKVYGARTCEPSYASKQLFSGGSGSSVLSKLKSLAKRVVAQFMLPDLQILWWPGLIGTLVKVIREEKPKVLFVSAPPFSSFMPVIVIGRLLGVPVILDYRDEWSFSRDQWENAVKHRLAKWLDRFFEGYAVRRCSAFTAANASYVAGICSTYKGGGTDKGHVITNGYDEDDLPPEMSRYREPQEGRQVRIIYTGTVWKATSLRNFIAALRKLIVLDPVLKDLLRIKVIGRVVDAEREYLQDRDLTGIVELCGYIEHGDLMGETMGADVLLITLSDLPGADKIITGKAFEYMGAGRHILALVPEGETKELLSRNYNKLTVVGADDIEGIVSAIAGIVAGIQKIRKTPGNDVSGFSRKVLAGKLAAVLDGVVAHGR